MRVVFADTGYWVALMNPRDDLHTKAQQLSQNIQPAHIVTTEMVLTEVLNDFSDRGDFFRKVAVNLIEKLYQHPNTTIIPQTSLQFQAALTLYKQRPDKEWSQTDCVSFKVMEKQAIAEALAYDKHFVQAGFQALMRNCQNQKFST
ncbi:MAG: PIN domain-containing protein [Oculatellaceae cyanobacterium bins.114]|nr:PIN domain-containing protein [Oculatellaceae cyanobacterium bins.114]